VSSVRRSFSTSQKKRNHASVTTAHERDAPIKPSLYREDNASQAPPSIQEIAMGLHVSRTPHLRPLGTSQHSSYPQKHPGRYPSQSALHPPSLPTSGSSHHATAPRRSSLKKPSAAASSSSMSHAMGSDLSVSLSTVTSNTLSTPRSNRSFSSLKLRVPWLSSGPSAPPEGADSLRGKSKHVPRKKAVRFTGHIPSQKEVD